ncbi:MAG TPA: decaprenyl-phosphate phosphoribosyltransferase [Pyrinomonadaceae bacterium]|nr:decaprenyl-phosphate phosphoribosyltransferase [Pyrinomonadaceae bacterium]
MSNLGELWRLLRPREWVKNGFVFVGLLFANAWHQPQLRLRVLIAAAAFCLVASGVYIFNDLFDREQDRNDARKKSRPLAAGRVSAGTAVILLIVLWILSFGLALLASRTVLGILLLYIVLNVAYSVRLKDVVLLDVFIIAAGFMLRILAGTVGVGIPPSQWLLLCGLMIALFLGFTKRRAELYATVNGEPGSQRKVLGHYQPVLLDKMIVITATCVILTYSLYTMSPVTIQTHHTEALIYTVPFVMYGIFRYIYSLHTRATGSDPSQEVFRDPHILFSILGWLVLTLWLLSRH